MCLSVCLSVCLFDQLKCLIGLRLLKILLFEHLDVYTYVNPNQCPCQHCTQSHQHARHSFNHITESPAPYNTNWEIQTFTMLVTHFSSKFQKCDRAFRIFLFLQPQIRFLSGCSLKRRGQSVSLRNSPPPILHPTLVPLRRLWTPVLCLLSQVSTRPPELRHKIERSKRS